MEVEAWWLASWSAIRQEFSDLPDIREFTVVCIRMLVAVVLGGVLGYERERAGSPAGFRTHMLVALGSALFVLVPLQAGVDLDDMSRVLQGVIAGIGFLGAGAIMRTGSGVQGLTTAATVWVNAAVGVAAGGGQFRLASIATGVTLLVLLLLHPVEAFIDRRVGKRRRDGDGNATDA